MIIIYQNNQVGLFGNTILISSFSFATGRLSGEDTAEFLSKLRHERIIAKRPPRSLVTLKEPVLRWAPAAFLFTEKNFRRVMGPRHNVNTSAAM